MGEAVRDRDMIERAASRAIAGHVGADAAVVVNNLAGAVVLAAAALLAGTDPARARRLPLVESGPDAVVLQRGHILTVGGAAVTQLLRLAGARPRPVGTVDRCASAEAEAAIEGAAGGFFLVGPPPPGADLLDLPAFAWLCRQARRPLVVVDRVASNVEAWLDAGADLVAFDTGSLGGPAAGVLAGRLEPVRAAGLQFLGIGAPLRANPETVAQVAEAAPSWRFPDEPQPEPTTGPRPVDAAVARALRFPGS